MEDDVKLLNVKGIKGLSAVVVRPYRNKSLAIFEIEELLLRGKLCLGVKTLVPIRKGEQENPALVVFVKQNSKSGIVPFFCNLLPGRNPLYMDENVFELDSLYCSGEDSFMWEHSSHGSWETREQAKAQLSKMGFKPEVIDRVFPPNRPPTKQQAEDNDRPWYRRGRNSSPVMDGEMF